MMFLGIPQGGAPENMPAHEAEIKARLDAFCQERGYVLAPNAGNIVADLVTAKHTQGDYYCPCQSESLPETVCVCEPVRNGLVEVMGTCYCALFFPPDLVPEA